MNGLHIYEDMDEFDEVFGDLDLTMLHAGEVHKVFVYGTLLPGMRNHRRLERPGVRKLSQYAQTDPNSNDWRLASRETQGGYGAPVLMPGLPHFAKGIVQGQVFEVSNEILMDLDRFEGHPDYYRREEHFVIYTTPRQKQVHEMVWMYVYQRDDATGDEGVSRTNIDTIADLYKWIG